MERGHGNPIRSAEFVELFLMRAIPIRARRTIIAKRRVPLFIYRALTPPSPCLPLVHKCIIQANNKWAAWKRNQVSLVAEHGALFSLSLSLSCARARARAYPTSSSFIAKGVKRGREGGRRADRHGMQARLINVRAAKLTVRVLPRPNCGLFRAKFRTLAPRRSHAAEIRRFAPSFPSSLLVSLLDSLNVNSRFKPNRLCASSGIPLKFMHVFHHRQLDESATLSNAVEKKDQWYTR